MRGPTLLGAAAGASLLLAGVVVAEREALERGPAGWEVDRPDLPVFLTAEGGAPRLPGQGWPLGWRWSWTHPEPRASGLSVRADVPEGGSLALGLRGVGDRELVVAVRAFGDRVTQVGLRDARAHSSVEGFSPLDCQGTATLPAQGPVWLELAASDPEGLEVRVGEQRLACTGVRVQGQPVLRAGLRRVGLHELRVVGPPPAGVADQVAPGPAWALRLLAAALGGGLGALLPRLAARAGLRPGLVSVALLPWLLAGPLAFSDVEGLAQAARLLWVHPLRAAVGGPLLASLGLAWAVGAGTWLAREATDRALTARVPVVIGSGALLALLLAAAARPQWGAASLWAAGGGAAGAALLWVNVRAARVRAFNLVSLALVGLALVCAEQALTWTATGLRLVGASNRTVEAPLRRQGEDPMNDFAIIDGSRQHSAYPSRGYPVAPPPRSAPLRIVALGSSSTGGAFQNDDLDQFWPADLGRRLGPQVQVVNQGVGGWTSLHIRRYVETRLPDLDADILVIYQGNNDLKQRSPRPYAALYAELEGARPAPGARLSAWLATVRLYQLLRFTLTPLTTQAEGVAVPIADARRNLSRIIERARAEDARVLLVREGVYPDPMDLASYGALMASLENGRDVAFLDGGEVLASATAWELFVDNVHLSRQGHERLAQAIAAELERLGWL